MRIIMGWIYRALSQLSLFHTTLTVVMESYLCCHNCPKAGSPDDHLSHLHKAIRVKCLALRHNDRYWEWVRI